MGPLPLRTVVDTADPVRARRFIFQILILTHSWQRSIPDKDQFPLEAVFSGGLPDFLAGELRGRGVRVIVARESVALPRIPTRNKFLAQNHGSPGRFALLDCDLILRRPFSDLLTADPGAVMAASADSLRVTDAQWAAAEAGLGLRFVRKKWVPPNDAFAARSKGLPPPESIFGYWNGGLVVIPAGGTFLSKWQVHTQRITRFFSAHPLETPAVSQSDQMGLAAAVSECQKFIELSDLHNFRPPHFWTGDNSWTDASALHLTNTREKAGGTLFPNPSSMLADYWNERILKPLERCPDGPERNRRRKNAQDCLDEILAGVRVSGIDAVAGRLYP